MAAAAAVCVGAKLALWEQVVAHVPQTGHYVMRSAFETLFIGGAAWIIVPFMAWQTARFSKFGVRTARGGLVVTVVAWAVCVMCARLP